MSLFSFLAKCYALREEEGESRTLKTKLLKNYCHSSRYVTIFYHYAINCSLDLQLCEAPIITTYYCIYLRFRS